MAGLDGRGGEGSRRQGDGARSRGTGPGLLDDGDPAHGDQGEVRLEEVQAEAGHGDAHAGVLRSEVPHALTARESAICLKDPECADPECRRRLAVMPFGKFKGQTLSWVYEQEPSYLAWFHECVDGCKEVKEAIRGSKGIQAHLAAFRQRRQPSPRQLTPTQQQVERLMGKFSSETVDKVCEELFGERADGQASATSETYWGT